jgi:AraC-like DNA-binding protein
MVEQMNGNIDLPYSPVTHIESLLHKVSKLGMNPNELIRNSRLSFTLNDISSGRIESLSRENFCRIFGTILGSVIRKFSTPTDRIMNRRDFDLFCHACLQYDTLEESLIRQIDFLSLYNGGSGRMELHAEDGIATLEIEMFQVELEWEFFFVFNAFAVYQKLITWLIGEDRMKFEFNTAFSPLMRHDARILLPSDNVTFGAPRHEVRFDAKFLKQPIVRTPLDLVEYLKHFPFDAALPEAGAESWADTVLKHYKLLLMREHALPAIPALASALGLSSATLRRRLREERNSIRQIKELARKELALRYLSETVSSASVVSSRLGFSCPKAFTRAFKSWTGATPAEYRNSLHSVERNQAAARH